MRREAITHACASSKSHLLDFSFRGCCNPRRRLRSVTIDELVYDWNTIEPSFSPPNRHIGIDDETLRDGLQSPSVTEPPVEQKLELLHLMEALNMDSADIGLPGAGGTHA